MKQGSALQAAAKWLGLVVGFLTLVLGIVHMAAINPNIRWPDDWFLDDVNAVFWRASMFSFAPSVFCDMWTPFVAGLWGIGVHFPGAGKLVTFPATDFLNYAIFNFVIAMFCNFAYNGGLGIIFAIITLIEVVLCLVVAFTDNDSASLELEVKFSR